MSSRNRYFFAHIRPIGDNSLTGEIPSEFGQLQDLQAFKLGHNKISGEIPTELGKLNELQRLSLGETTIPTCFSDNHISDISTFLLVIHMVIFTLTNNTGSNKLMGGIPSEFGTIASLTHVDLGESI